MRTPTTSSQLSRRLWLLFALFIVYGTTIPFRFTHDMPAIAEKVLHLRLNPFVSAGGGRPSISDSVQNILLFLPFGALGMLARRPGARPLPRALLVTAAAAALSIAVEAAQLFTTDRICSANDVFTDTLGGFVGAMAADVAGRVSMRSLRALARAGLVDVGGFFPFFVATLVVAAAAWEPFDVTIDVGSVARKLRALRWNVWQYTGFGDEGISIVHYALFSVACCAWLRALRVRRPGLTTIAIGVPVAFLLEASQLGVSSRMPGLEDAVVEAAGVVIGAMLWRAAQRVQAPWAWLGLLVIATAAAAAMEILTPFELAAERHLFNWLPFMGYYAYTTFQTLSHVLELWLLYFPLGFGFAVMARQPARAIAAAAVVGCAIATPLEYGQGWIVGRFPDVTDIAMSVVGACLGAWVGTRGAEMFGGLVSSLRQP
ncbi:MAG: VanZ family protein [Acidobacteriota bacterium]